MLITIVVAASLLMLAGMYSLVHSLFFSPSDKRPKNWNKLLVWSLLAGLVLGLASWLGTFWMLLPYPNIAGEGWFAGFPYMAVYIDATNYHYQFSFTRTSVIANAVFWFLLPMAGLHVYGRHWRRQQKKPE
ncbi:hypothetical protein [Undibacterium pigrum]|uniref:Uncharacterized protein n=1 Tax=Undibacterium pigrum TaxID=401470 RepID=A0A318JAS3_9BURK|nr:hypothetical protein [Undibacterium pigrum]PXX43753.1 hypothetical protein DFR42_10321 [Undibacterium pigrum]